MCANNVKEDKNQDVFKDIIRQKESIESPCNPLYYKVLKRIASNPENYFVVSFGGGSAPGLAGNTALMALLDELDITPYVKEIWGASAGSIVGSAWSVGVSAEEGLNTFDDISEDTVLDISKWDLFVKGLLKFIFKRKLPDGFILGKKFRHYLRICVRDKSFSETNIPLRIIAATDDGYAKKIVFKEGKIVDAIMASMCLPGVSCPVNDWNGKPYGYLDGGIVEKTPLNCIIDDYNRSGNKKKLVILCTHFSNIARIKKPVGFMQRFFSVVDYLTEETWEYYLLKANQCENCKTIILNPRIEAGSGFDFSSIRNNYLWSRKVFKEQLSNTGLAQRFDAR